MQNTIQMQQEINHLRGQNEQLNYKYKKALREILQVLKINKILKESNVQKQSQIVRGLNKQIDSMNQQFELVKQMNLVQLKELRSQKQDREARLKLHEPRLKLIEQQRDKFKADLALSVLKIREYQTRDLQKKRQDLNNSPKKLELLEQFSLVKKQNERMAKTILRLQPLQQQKQQFISQIQLLNGKIAQSNKKVSEQQLKRHSQLQSLQNQYRQYQIQHNNKMKELQKKCSVYEIEMNNFRSIQKFIDLQSHQMLEEQNMFNSIRSQLEKVNDDFSRFENQNGEYFNKIKQQQAEKIRKIAELQAQISKYQSQIQQNRKIIQKYDIQVQEKINVQKQVSVLQKDKRQLIQRISVLQALTITQKHRSGLDVTQKIEQFERKIHLLLEQNGQSIAELGGFHQIILLKSYIRELSELLSNYKKREEKLIKKNQSLKMELKEMEHSYRGKVVEHKKKVNHYDSLVERLYNLLEERMAERPFEQQKQKDINMAFGKYQQKMLRMTDEIIQLRNRKGQLQGQHRSKGDEQHQKLVATISKLQFNLSGMEAQNKSLMAENKLLFAQNKSLSETIAEQTTQAKQIILNKDNIITALTQQVQYLSEEKKSIQQKQVQFLSVKYNYQKQINRLHDALKLRSSRELPLSNRSNNNEALTLQIAKLESQLKETKQQQSSIFYEKQGQLGEKQSLIIQLNNKINSLQRYVDQLKTELGEVNKNNEALNKINSDMAVKQKEVSEELSKKIGVEGSKSNQPIFEQTIQQKQTANAQLISRLTKQINQLNTTILAIRTENLVLKNELQEKDFSISELKHQIYNNELKIQKQKSRQNLLPYKQTIPQQQQSNQHLLMSIVLLAAQVEALHNRMAQIQNNPNAFIKNSIIYESELIQMPQHLEISNEVEKQGPMTPKQIKSRIASNPSINIASSQPAQVDLMKLSSHSKSISRENIEIQTLPPKIESFSQENIKSGGSQGEKYPVKGNPRSEISISNSLTMENLQTNSIEQSFQNLTNSNKVIVTQRMSQSKQEGSYHNEPLKQINKIQISPIEGGSLGFVKLIKQSSQSINVEGSPIINFGKIVQKQG